MASATPTWAIPYPQSTDDFCTGYLDIQAMAERVDEILDDFDSDLAGAQVVPLARVQSIPAETPTITFEITNFDTANLATLARQGTLTESARTYFVSGLTARFTNTGATAGDLADNSIDSTNGTVFEWTQRDPAGNNNNLSSWAGFYRNSATTDSQAVTDFTFSGTATVTVVTVCYYWILKVGNV